MPNRQPSLNRLPDAKSFQTKAREADVDKAEARSTKSYPAGKPMHRSAAPSYLSAEASAQNYRGFFNLGIILLVISNFRLILGTVQSHGFVVTYYLEHWSDLSSIRSDPWGDTNAFVSGFILQLMFLLTGFGIEFGLSQNRLNESVGMM
jgi:diacylglycerol O-acyltransferase-1